MKEEIVLLNQRLRELEELVSRLAFLSREVSNLIRRRM